MKNHFCDLRKSIDVLLLLKSKDAKSFSSTVRGMLLTLEMVGTGLIFSECTFSVNLIVDKTQCIRKKRETISFTRTKMEIGT